ncbi:MAG: sensor histidine kinase [Roseiarcus sp.]
MPTHPVDLDSFRLAVDASPAAMIMTNPEGVIAFANAETERMFGYAVEALIGQSIDVLVPERLRHAHAGLRRGFFAAPSKRPMGAGRDLKATRNDGAEFPVEIALTPIETDNGPIVLATVIDITARRKAEDELAQRARELERANERLEQFAYIASHDLQEPLRKIAVFAALLGEAVAKSNAADIARATEVIGASATRARQLVDNLLTFSRAINDESAPQPLALREEIGLALTDLSQAIEESGARIVVDAHDVVVDADRAQFARLLQNVVANAIKYRKPGRAPTIAISVERVEPSAARLAISDDGIGFDERYAKEIFEPFKRLHGAKDYPGTGIGLAICKTIAERYGWTISVASQPGEGSTFFVTFPSVAQ